jgi:thiaminase
MKHGVTVLLGICETIDSNEKEKKTRRDFTYYVHDDSVVLIEFARITCLNVNKSKSQLLKVRKVGGKKSSKSEVQVYGAFDDENIG